MKSPLQRSYPVIVLIALVALIPVVSSTLAHAEQNTVVTAPSLHNPNLDNGHWYEFHIRYQGSYPTGVWLPAGTDMYDTTQDWRIWFLDGTDVVDCNPYTKKVHSAPEAVKIRSFDWSPIHRQVAGLYQVIENVTPCRYYQFQMYGLSRQEEADDSLAALRVGIEPTGWHPDSANDPAIHGAWPAGTVMGDSHAYIDPSGYGPLAVTAEAFATEIVVFTYADAYGGNSHKIQWDTGSFQSVTTPDLISDPNNPSGNSSGISSEPTESYGRTGATIYWNTSVDALSQVYYYRTTGASTPPPSTETLTHTVYSPSFFSSRAPSTWLLSDVDESFTSSHSVSISGLQPNTTYEYFVASRGPSNDTCVTWVSSKKQFTTNP